MSKHLFGIVCTPHGPAANNRGETDGNVTSLQKLLWNGRVHTTVSAEAIRFAIRQDWHSLGEPVNRYWDETKRQHAWNDPGFLQGPATFIDDDLLGFMSAKAAKQEGAKGETRARRSRLELTRAVSLSPWAGDVTFNAASIGATPSAQMKGSNPVPYGTEVHATRYQYGFALTPEALEDPSRAVLALRSLTDLHDVAGNHARFLYDFSPASVVFRWTDDFAPRMLYAFDSSGDGIVGCTRLVRAVEAGDIAASELIVGGEVADTDDGARLRVAGATVFPGVLQSRDTLLGRVSADLSAG